MSGNSGGLDARSKAGRALSALIAASMKMTPETRARVARVRNMLDANADDPGIGHKIEMDLSILMRDSKLNAHCVALRKALRAM